MADAVGSDPLVGFDFGIEISGQLTGYFTEVSGLGSENAVIEHKIVTPDGHEIVRKIPGRLRWGDVTLKRGITDVLDIWEWRKLVEDGKVSEARRDGSIIMFSQDHKEMARWNFVRAWPSKVTGPAPRSDSNEVSIEELTITHEGIERVKAG